MVACRLPIHHITRSLSLSVCLEHGCLLLKSCVLASNIACSPAAVALQVCAEASRRRQLRRT